MHFYNYFGSINRVPVPKGAFGIVPLDVWLDDVITIHAIAGLSLMNPTSPFWRRMYFNNVSPLMACQWNYDFAPSPFNVSSFYNVVSINRRYRFTMCIAPRYGIGETGPIEGFEP